MEEDVNGRVDVIPDFCMSNLLLSLRELQLTILTAVGDIVQTARLPKATLTCGMNILFPHHDLQGVESPGHNGWIKKPADHYYEPPHGPEGHRFITSGGCIIDNYFNTFSLAGEVPQDYDFYSDSFDENSVLVS